MTFRPCVPSVSALRSTSGLPLCLVAALGACGPEGDPYDLSPGPTYVGSGSCISCHSTEVERWAGSHHDLAMQEATSETVLGNFEGARFEDSGSTWTFSRTDEQFVAGLEGTPGSPQEYRVKYAFGATPLQQYMVEFPGGRYQVLPIAWDSRPADQGGQRWFNVQTESGLVSGDAPHWTGPLLNWNSMCADCHSTGVRKNYAPETDRFSTEWAEIDVGCEACHGPGSGHLAWVKTTDPGPAGVSADTEEGDRGFVVHFEPHDPGVWIPDPRTRTAHPRPGPAGDGQLDVCGRCHSRRSEITTGYRHNAALLDSHEPALLDEGLYFADGQMQDEVYVWGSFVQSAMYRAGVTCNDCHDPHSLGLREEKNGLCARCHVSSTFDNADHHFHAAGTEPALCVSCHMPSRTYMGVDARRDHSFRVPDPEASEAVGAPDPCTTCHSGMSGAEAAAEIAGRLEGVPVNRTRFHARAMAAARIGDPEGIRGLHELLEDPRAPAITKATALTLLGSDQGPVRTAAVRRGLQDVDPLVRLGALRGVGNSPTPELVTLAAPLLDDPVRSVRLAAVEAVAPLAGPSYATSRPGSAPAERLEEFRNAQLAREERPEAQLNLAWLAALQGAYDDAERALRRAIRLDPTFVPAYVNLTEAYRRSGRDLEGEPLLRSALGLSPQSADLHHALGLLLVRNGRADEAMALLRRAAELDEQNPRYAHVYAVALQSENDTSAARTVLEEALARHPWDRDLLVALAVLHRDAGRLEQALGYARTLVEAHPYDSAARALISQLDR